MVLAAGLPALTEEEHARLRRKMVTGQLRAGGIRDGRVLASMGRVPRHRFVPPAFRESAYANMPLPIGHGQTISQPLMVAVMLETAELSGTERVLEIGTGSGYQAALLGELADEVYSLEIIPELAQRAREELAELRAHNVTVVTADGSAGWPESAPYDVILVAAAAPSLPQPLVEQLADGGRLIMPIGDWPDLQRLHLVHRHGGKLRVQTLDYCAFVPLRGELGVPIREASWEATGVRKSTHSVGKRPQ